MTITTHGPVDSITCIGCGWMRKGWKFFKRSWFSSNLKMYYLWFQVVSTIVFTVGDVNEAPYDLHLTSSNAPIQFPEDKPKVKENAKGRSNLRAGMSHLAVITDKNWSLKHKFYNLKDTIPIWQMYISILCQIESNSSFNLSWNIVD